MTRLRACLLVSILWAAIYLPGLGSTELKGEEGRRILPAMTMLETGNWLVPYVGGKPFLRKPPLVNWAIAASFAATGIRNEWTARLPSALCVLALGLAIVGTSRPARESAPERGSTRRRWLSPDAAFVAAVIAMTQSGLLAKARFAGAEIEGIYAPLSGMALVCWLAWWLRGCSAWLTWLVPGALLGLGCLAKGPSLHLLFFYAVVIGVIWKTREWRRLLHPAPIVGAVLTLSIFAAWAVPYFRAPETTQAAEVWKRQGIDRFTDSEFNAGNYFANIPRALADQLPWLMLAPLAIAGVRRREQADAAASVAAFRGAAIATAASFLLVLLIPGTLPRYVLPLGAMWALLLAWSFEIAPPRERGLRIWRRLNVALGIVVMLAAFLTPLAAGAALESRTIAEALRSLNFRAALYAGAVSAIVLALCAVIIARRERSLTPQWLVGASGALIAGATFLYAAAAVRWIQRDDNLRPLAHAIDAAVPPGNPLFLYDPGYMASVFYLRTPVRYAPTQDVIPQDAVWLLARAKEKERLADKRPEFAVVQTIAGKRGEKFLLLQRPAEVQKLRAP